MVNLNLAGTWTLTEPTSGFVIDGSVPGSVFHDLLQAGKMDDPYHRFNEEQAIPLSEKVYTYRKTFVVPKELFESNHVVLVCEGLDTLADITVNGRWLAHTENMHRRYEFPIKEHICIGQNTIEIRFSPSVSYIKEAHRKNPIWGQPDTLEGFTQLRKAHYMFGWDWGPKIPDAGIFRPIYINGYSTARLTDIETKQFHEAGRVCVVVDAAVERLTQDACIVEFNLNHPTGVKDVQTVKLEGGKAKTEFWVENPELWWPNGVGEQPLYELQVSLFRNESSVQNTLGERSSLPSKLDEKGMRIGLRTLTIRREQDEWGESFEFVVNGYPIFAKGANYIPEENVLGRLNVKKTKRIFEDCVEANFNLIRVWGGGFYPDDSFYDLADEMGLIVWQDFMYACGTYALTPEFEANIRAEAEDVIRRIRHHASLGLLCGNNEMEEAWCDWEFPKPDHLRADYLRHFEEILPSICARFAPQTFYWQASPSSGGNFDNPNDEHRGDVHYWKVWHALKPFTEYRKFYFRFCSEFGFQSFPSMKTIESFTLPEDRNVFSYVMEKHQKNNAANGKILFYLSDNFQYPKDMNSLVYVSQILQAEAIKYGVEHWRRNLGRCMGSIYWQLNDCWPVASWSSIDYYGRWKALHYFAKRFYQPILLSAEESETGATLVVTNDTHQVVNGVVRWALHSTSGEVLHHGQKPISAEPLGAMIVETLDYSNHLQDEHARRKTYLEFELVVDEERVYSSSILFVKAKHFEFENPLIRVAVEEVGDEFQIELSASHFAKYVELDFKNADARFDDNYFDLIPGNPKTIRLSKNKLSSPLSPIEIREELCVRSLYDSYAEVVNSSVVEV